MDIRINQHGRLDFSVRIFFITHQSLHRLIHLDIYHLCSASPESYAERLYEETKKFLEEHCISMKKEIEQSEQNTLTIYVKYWNEYKLGAEHLNNLYS